MQRLPQIFLGTLATLALSVGCSSPAQTPVDETEETASEAAIQTPFAENSFETTKVQPAAAPGFIKVSSDLRLAIGSLGKAAPQQSIEMLRNLRKNFMAPAHEKQLSAYVLARLLFKNKSPGYEKESVALFEEASGYAPLSTAARLHGSEIAIDSLGLNDPKKAAELLSPLLKRAEEIGRSQKESAKNQTKQGRPEKKDAILPKALHKYGELLFRAKDYGAATNVFERLREVFPDTEYATASSYYLGNISILEGDWNTALKEFRHYLSLAPRGKSSLDICQSMLEASQAKGDGTDANVTPPLIQLTPSDHNLMALAFYKHSRYGDALREWASTGSQHIYQAVCLSKAGKRVEAHAFLLRQVDADPANPLIVEVTSALCKPLTGKEALVLWQEVLKRNPKEMDNALWNVAKRLGTPEGVPYYSRLVAETPTSEFAPESAWWLVWSEMKQAYAKAGAEKKLHFARALGHCNKAMKLYPHTHIGPKFAFWQGKLYEALGQNAQAIVSYQHAERHYPGSYYGFRSLQRCHHLRSQAESTKEGGEGSAHHVAPDRRWSMHLNRQPWHGNWSWPGPPELFHWPNLPHSLGETAATLVWLRQYDECFDYATGKAPPEVKAWVYHQQGMTLIAVANASLNLEGYPIATARWQMAYPLAYGDIVRREAKKRGLDPYLVHGVIRQESRYDPNAVSRSNAMGLMQLLKGTAYGVAKHNAIPLSSANQIFNPETNIQLGCAYLAYVLKRAEGNAMLAVASYNGGPNAVAKWLRQYQAAGLNDMDVYVENIPYDETRDYVRKVFAHYWNYEHLYGREHKASPNTDG